MQDFIYEMYSIKDQEKMFPGTLPVDLDQTNLEQLKKSMFQYVITIKADGERFLVLFYEKKIFLFGRNLIFTEIAQCENNKYDRTLLDVELIDSTLYTVDAIAYCNLPLRKYSFITRLKIASEFLFLQKNFFVKRKDAKIGSVFQTDYYKLWNSKYLITVKEQYYLKYLHTMFDCNKELKNDGLIFQCASDAIVPYRNTNMYKWKPFNKITIDVFVDNDKIVSCWNDKSLLDIPFCIENEEFIDSPGIYECLFIDEQKLKALKKRNDKLNPNSYDVIQRIQNTLKNYVAIENVNFIF